MPWVPYSKNGEWRGMDRADLNRLIAEFEQIKRFQVDSLDGLEAQARLVRDRLVGTETALASLRILLGGAAADHSVTPPNSIATKTKPRTQLSSAAARQRSPARRIMIAALERAGKDGIHASALNKVVTDAEMSRDTAEKSKAAMKRTGVIGHDAHALRWYAAGCGPADVEADRKERASRYKEKEE